MRNYSATLDALKSYVAEAVLDFAADDNPPFHVDTDMNVDLRKIESTPFESTGNAKLDAVVERVSPRLVYGVHPSTQMPSKDVGPDGVAQTRGIIGMPHRNQFNSDADYRAILAHELVHWTKSAGMVPRPAGGMTGLDRLFGFLPPDYPREELVAEIGSALLLDAVGEPPDLATRASYVKGWASAIAPDERDEALDWASGKAQEAVNWLLGEA